MKWRLGSELNRRTRLCRPLHNHSATQPCISADFFGFLSGERVDAANGLERETGFEPATSTLARLRSTN